MAFGDVPLALLERYAAGAGTPEELAAIDAWIGGDPRRRLLVERLRSVFAAPDSGSTSPSEADVERAWEALAARMNLQTSGPGAEPRRRSVVVLAALVLALIALIWYALSHRPA